MCLVQKIIKTDTVVTVYPNMSKNDTNDITECEMIAILDFGSQYSHLIARRLREMQVYCELFDGSVTAQVLQRKEQKLKGIVLSGGPSSVFEENAPHVHESVWALVTELQTPVLGICYGMQEIARVFGGDVTPNETREFGKAEMTLCTTSSDDSDLKQLQSLLFSDHVPTSCTVWMSHGDRVSRLPPGFLSLATSKRSCCAMGSKSQSIFAVQFHPEVTHSSCGFQVLHNFAYQICSVQGNWIMKNVADQLVQSICAKVGSNDHVIGAVSGGVDSTVAAVLLHRAIGHRFHCVLVDNGFLRENEGQRVSTRLRERLQMDLQTVDASDRFLGELSAVSDPETKRKLIGALFIGVFQEQADIIQESLPSEENVTFLLQGTLYPDVIESQSHRGPSAIIKSHHNVGGLPAAMRLRLIEPLRYLFKDEVRELGAVLGIDRDSLWRHPFPGPGLAIRVLGPISPERVSIVRRADAILIEELIVAGVYDDIAQVCLE
jgi:GMP synthase (glutamine-hydrolysing)